MLSLPLFQVYKLSRENTRSENFVFEKTKGRGGTVNRTSVHAEAAVRRGLLKKCVMRNFAEFTIKYLCRILFFEDLLSL